MKEYKRNCPVCTKQLIHKNYVSFRHSVKNNKPCSKCANKERANRPEERLKNSLARRGKNTGKDNPFYGKTHTEETKKIIKEKRKNQIIPKGKKHPLYGKKLEQIVGKEKSKEIKLKLSKKFSGKNNPMYGKPAPKGSGNGWSGWYNGWFFRSIMELSYMLNVIERFNLTWESGEKNKYAIKYTDDDKKSRTYFPDFIINDKYIVEIKPKNLHKSKKIIEKVNAANEYAKNNNMVFKIREVSKLTDLEIKKLIENNEIQLTERYKKKYEEKYNN